MNQDVTSATVEIMGKSYQIRCLTNEVASLQNAAHYLEDKMHNVKEMGKVLSIDRIAILAALNIVHEFLNNDRDKLLQQRIAELQLKVENALANSPSLESVSAE
jgi:cell division protein ZapA